MNMSLRCVLAVLATATACGRAASPPAVEPSSPAPTEEAAPAPAPASLAAALSFHAGFDTGPDAGFARGDARLYTATSYKKRDDTQAGIHAPDVKLVAEGGRFAGALHFAKRNQRAIFFRARDNVAFEPKSWSGTVSFWLRLDPNRDLEPGYCDPIQVTDETYKDAAIWVDFTKDDKPRHFRLGVFGDLEVWNPKDVQPAENPDFLERVVPVEEPPFARDRWTHVVITFAGLGSGQGEASLYLDGAPQGSAKPIPEPFTWDLDRAALRIGVNYVGYFDELAAFDRPLTPEEVEQLHELAAGVASLYPASSGPATER
jgi:hypothetical protein